MELLWAKMNTDILPDHLEELKVSLHLPKSRLMENKKNTRLAALSRLTFSSERKIKVWPSLLISQKLKN